MLRKRKYFVCTGRMSGADEDALSIIPAKTLQEATGTFEEELRESCGCVHCKTALEHADDPEFDPNSGDGHDFYLNYVVACTAKPKVVHSY